jgi:P4 family phage/plasmid primase-like protien
VTQLVPVALFERGYTDLISVIPPGATLSPGSKIAANSLGKAPGIKYANGTWGGYNWRTWAASEADVTKWANDGANIGLRAGRFPGLDIDSMNPAVVEAVKQLAFEALGPAPVRTGKAPKALLMYYTAEPFTRMRMWLEGEKEVHLIELLGEGQQYLVHGTHPGTMRPYSWNQEVPIADALHSITVDTAHFLFLKIKQHFTELGFTVRQEGDGRKQARTLTTEQGALRAPTIEALAAAVAAIPNGANFANRDEWIRMGAAIRAACGEELEEGFNIWAEWSSRWEDGENEDDYIRQNWRRLYPPFAVGWGWIEEKARAGGYNAAVDEFPAEGVAPAPQPADDDDTESASLRVRLSDAWLADKVVATIGERLRYVPATGRWLAWSGSRWEPDGLLRAQAEIGRVLHAVAKEELVRDYKKVEQEARRIEAAHTLFAVMSLVKADRGIAVEVSALDADPWVLNTPAGVVDLKTGAISAGLPEQLLTKTTKVGPSAEAPLWTKFLLETTGGNLALMSYLQRLAGYCLTGLTIEQTLGFIWGPGGNGKSVFLNTIRDVLGDYATVSTMTVFTASSMDRHSTELADLMGARLVVASETQAGRLWDEQRLKMLSAGDAVKARFMRQDNVMYRPAFKLLFAGNHQPHIKTLDEAMKRRIHMIPFNQKPLKVDLFLSEKLRAEYSGILGWMLRGCAEWQEKGLQPPDVVLAQTQEYFEEEDIIGRWMEDRLNEVPEAVTSAQALFDSFREWCGEVGERPGRINDLVQGLRARGFQSNKDLKTRRMIYRGLQVDKQISFGEEPIT